MWYVIMRARNSYPLSIYTDRQLAEDVAKSNNECMIPVTPCLTGNWYVLCDNNCPLQICEDKKLAEAVAQAKNERIVSVVPLTNA